ncbi:MAG: sulfotransferase family 2 domain-containing protein [Litoreibacter sp.]|uniref:sulfotransferase family 2 domain-containing protein n=1 Tax=Litoreibacter sp. TaxID=1969459 RepID=UPI003298E64B
MLVVRNLFERFRPACKGMQLLFVHTPKCGGSYVQAALGPGGKKCFSVTNPLFAGHLSWQKYRDRLALVDQSIADFTTFSVVRNPFDWHVSWFNYIRNPLGGRRSGYHVEHHLFQTMDFADYVHWLGDPKGVRSVQFDMGRLLCDWVVDESGKIVVNEILRQEQLEDGLAEMKQRHNLRIKLPAKKINTSNASDYRSFYTAKEVDIISERHARDLDMFGYTFE